MIRLFSALLILLSATTFTGCGGGSSGTGASSGLDPDRIISTLSVVEYGDICKELQQDALKQFKKHKRGFCSMGAVIGALFESEQVDPVLCETIKNDCLNAPVEADEDSDPTESCPIRKEGIASCSGTVAQINDCFSSAFGLLGDTLDQISCGDSIADIERKLASANELLTGSANVNAECAALRSQCTHLLVMQN